MRYRHPMLKNVLFMLVAASCSACSAVIMTPAEEAIDTPRPVFVVDHGWHTSLVLTDEEGGMVRYVYGDWRWYAEADTGFLRAFPTLFLNTRGALGRQLMPAPASAEAIRTRSRVAIDEIHTLSASAERVDALIVSLAGRFAAADETRTYSQRYGLEFVHDAKPYRLGRNSNHRLAEWLEELGMQVSGNPVFGRWHISSD